MSWAEADTIVDDVLDGVQSIIESQPSSKNYSAIVVTTTSNSYIGETVFARLTNGFEVFQGTLTDQGDGTGKAVIYTPYLGQYRAFVDQDSYSLVTIENLGEIVSTTVNPYFLYGYKIAKYDTNPATRVTYTDMAVGFTPLTRDFAEDTTDMGDWEDTFIFKAFRPLMLQSNGSVAYELNHSDQRYRLDGVTASDISNASFDGNAMVGVGTMWFKRWEDEDYEYCQICDRQLDSDFKAYAHTGSDGHTILEEIYLPMFEGSYVSSKVRSLAGQTPMNTNAGATEKTGIEANGAGWQFDDLSNWQLVRDVLYLFGKSTDVQAVYGKGHQDGGTAASSLLQTGTKKDKGAFSCSNTNDASKVLWLENYYGDRWDRKYGVVYTTAGKLLIKAYPPYNTDGTGYKNTGITFTGTSGGYISKTKMTEYGMLPLEAAGSDSTYDPDGLWWNTTQLNFLLAGGHCGDGAHCGFAWYVNNPFSYSSWHIGPSLSYKAPVAA